MVFDVSELAEERVTLKDFLFTYQNYVYFSPLQIEEMALKKKGAGTDLRIIASDRVWVIPAQSIEEYFAEKEKVLTKKHEDAFFGSSVSSEEPEPPVKDQPPSGVASAPPITPKKAPARKKSAARSKAKK